MPQITKKNLIIIIQTESSVTYNSNKFIIDQSKIKQNNKIKLQMTKDCKTLNYNHSV